MREAMSQPTPMGIVHADRARFAIRPGSVSSFIVPEIQSQAPKRAPCWGTRLMPLAVVDGQDHRGGSRLCSSRFQRILDCAAWRRLRRLVPAQ